MATKSGFWGMDALNELAADQLVDGGSGEVRMREAAYTASGATVDPDEDLWRPLTGDATRDLTPLTQWRMREIARYLWETTPLGNWLIETPIDFIVAEGVKLTAENEDAQGWLDEFWNDPINRMDLTLEDKIRELSLYGEQCWIAFTNELNGHVRLGYLNPGLIETVVMDPDNRAMPIGIVTTPDKKQRRRKYRIIAGNDENVFSTRTQEIRSTFTDGECFYWKINSLCEGKHGRSDLLPVADWLDGYEEFMFGESDRVQFLKAFIWDVTLQGATQEEVEQKARSIASPKPGSARVHNENETWKAEAPAINAADTSQAARMFRNHILGGRALPEHWFGGGGDVNRATASEMDAPTMKRMKRRQRFVKFMLEEVGNFVIANRLAATSTSVADNAADEYRANAEMPELESSDVTKFAQALQQIASAMSGLINSEVIDKETALKFLTRIAAEMDIEFDADSALTKAQEAAAKKAEQDVFTEPPVASEAA